MKSIGKQLRTKIYRAADNQTDGYLPYDFIPSDQPFRIFLYYFEIIVRKSDESKRKSRKLSPIVATGKQQVLRKIVSQHFKKPILSIAMAPNLMYGLPKTINWLSIMTLSIR